MEVEGTNNNIVDDLSEMTFTSIFQACTKKRKDYRLH